MARSAGAAEHVAPSGWRLEVPQVLECVPLAGDARADVVIIGGGFTGLACALTLAEAGVDVVLLEAGPLPGWQASGRSGGQVCTGFAPGQAGLERMLGRERANALFALAEEGKALLAQWQWQHGFKAYYRGGYLICAAHPAHVRELHEELEELRRAGYAHADACRIIGRQQLAAEFLGTDVYHAALFDPGAGVLNPLALCAGLARAAAGLGARLHARSAVLYLQEDGGHVVACTAHGSVRAEAAVLAANAANGRLWPALAPYILPVRACQIATEPLEAPLARRLLRQAAAVVDTQLAPNYFSLTSQRRLVFGCGASYLNRVPRRVAQRQRRCLRRVFPALPDLQQATIEAAWCGTIAVTANRYPHAGRTGHGGAIRFAHGFSGQGVVLAPLLGMLMAEDILGNREGFDLFAAIPHRPHAGGPLRLPLHALRMAWRHLRNVAD